MATTAKTTKSSNPKQPKTLRGGSGKRPRENFTPAQLLAWADHISGVPHTVTAKKLHVTPQSVRDFHHKVEAFIAKEVDINVYRLPLFQFYPLLIESVAANLKKHDVPMTIAILKGLQITVDKQVNENTDNLGALSDAELAERVVRRLSVTTK